MILVGARKKRSWRKPALAIGALLLVGGAIGVPASRFWVGGPEAPVRRVFDVARILPKGIDKRLETYTQQIFLESDVDIRLVLMRSGRNADLEVIAPDLMRQLDAGAVGNRQRGLLLAYDVTTKRGRIEVGYGLEEYFPDGFVGYLLRSHVEKLFATGDPTQAIHLLLRVIHHRIREAVLDRRFDPRVLEVIDDGELSGGAGASLPIQLASDRVKPKHARVGAKERSRLGPQKTPEDAYRAYLAWLAAGTFDPTIELFTEKTREMLSRFPMTPGYFDSILLQEYGQPYELLTRGDRALLIYTSSPLLCPQFFLRTERGWQIDLAAGVANTANVVGGIYNWNYRGEDDAYTNRFADELIKIGNYIRLARGDNRPLPIRNPATDPTAARIPGRAPSGA